MEECLHLHFLKILFTHWMRHNYTRFEIVLN
jgi:hypothetical protein